jgi:small subunit ribosomal protein S4
MRLREKQKLRYHYGLTERGLRLLYQKAYRQPGDTGRNLLTLLESRLDNLVWRAGLTRTMPAARQLIGHGHININSHRATSPGQHIKVGQSFTVREKTRNREDLRVSVNAPVLERPAGIKVDLDTLTITIEALPGPEQVPVQVNIQKVIEFFAQ